MPKSNGVKTDAPVPIARTTSKYHTTRFIAQLYRVLQLAETEDPEQRYIHWSANGEAIVITSVPELTKQLSFLFRAKNYGSFVRQLNMYNFMKVKGLSRTHVFLQPFFQRDSPEALRHVTRKRVISRASHQDRLNDQINTQENQSAGVVSIFDAQRRRIATLQDNNELRAFNARLRQQLLALNLEDEEFTRQLLVMLIMTILLPPSQLLDSLLEAQDTRFKLKIRLVLASIQASSEDPVGCLGEHLMDANDTAACLKQLANIFEKVNHHSTEINSPEDTDNKKLDGLVDRPGTTVAKAQYQHSCESSSDRLALTDNTKPAEALGHSNAYSNEHNIREGEDSFSFNEWARNTDSCLDESKLDDSIFDQPEHCERTYLSADSGDELEAP